MKTLSKILLTTSLLALPFVAPAQNKIKNKIEKKLQTKEFSYREKEDSLDYVFPEYYKLNIDSLDEYDYKLIHATLKELEKEKFRNQIGKWINEDGYDFYSEWGGVISLINNKIKMDLIPSTCSIEQTQECDDFYTLPENIKLKENGHLFHMHAKDFDESPFSGPSLLDISSQQNEARFRKKEIREFLITSIGYGEFNIDFYKTTPNPRKTTVIDLGNYKYQLPHNP